MAALDRQVGGSHYKGLAIQPVRFCMSNQMGGSESSIVKYASRWRGKGGVEDLRKSDHYIDLILEDYQYCAQLAVNRRRYIINAQMGAISADEYIYRNRLENPAAGVIRHMWFWNISARTAELKSARKWLEELIQLALEEQAA